jgi:hypothetical protein
MKEPAGSFLDATGGGLIPIISEDRTQQISLTEPNLFPRDINVLLGHAAVSLIYIITGSFPASLKKEVASHFFFDMDDIFLEAFK